MIPFLAGMDAYLDTLEVEPVGAGPGAPADAPRPADPRREYVAVDGGLHGLDEPDREGPLYGVHGWHGLREYEAMARSPEPGASFDALRAGVLSGGVSLLPAVRASSDPAPPAPDQQDGTAVEAEMAAALMASNARLLHRWETPVDNVLWEMMESMYLGHSLAEVVMDDVAGGPDDGLLAVRDLRTKPRRSYRFRVDRRMNVVAIRCRTEGGWETFGPEHFAWLTWDPKNGDPRGRSVFRKAHYHWRLLMDLWPKLQLGFEQFGVPSKYGTTAPGAKQVPRVDKNGTPIPGAPAMTPEFAMSLMMARMKAGDSLAGPNGSDVKVVESSKDSSVAASGVSIYEGQIVRSILLQLRATVEAKHGSRADSETGQDIMGTIIRFVRKWLERFLRSVLIYQNTLNYGEDIALRCTPLVTLGDHEHQDFAANAQGVSALVAAGFFAEEQLPTLDTFLGFMPRKAGSLRVGPNGPIPTELPEPAPVAAPTDAAPSQPQAGGAG